MRAFFARVLLNASVAPPPPPRAPGKAKPAAAAAAAAAEEALAAAGGGAFRAAVPFPTSDFELVAVNPASQVL